MSLLQHLLNDTMESPALPATLNTTASASPSPQMEQLPPPPQPPTDQSLPAASPPVGTQLKNNMPAERKLSPTSSVSADGSRSSNGPGGARSNKRRRTNKSNGSSSRTPSPRGIPANANATPLTLTDQAPISAVNSAATAPQANGNVDGAMGKSMRRVAETQEKDKDDKGNAREIPPELISPTGCARLSKIDRSPKLILPGPDDNDPLALPRIVGHKGFRSARGTHGLVTGSWYFEVKLLEMPLKPVPAAVRVGWSTRRLDIETPVGYSAYSFGLRDRTCEFINGARRRQYAPEHGPLKVGDIIGCLIVLPPNITQHQREKINMAEFLMLEFAYCKLGVGNAPADAGFSFDKAYCQWFKNGICLGTPEFFDRRNHELDELAQGAPDMPKNRGPGFHAGFYYPTISLYNDAMVAVNFGPEFKHPVPEGAKPYIEIGPKDVPEPEKSIPMVPEPAQEPVNDASKSQATQPLTNSMPSAMLQ